jgi:protein-tyrosine phosphatase
VTLQVLVLCTANRCRSPMAEALLAQRLAAAGIEAEVSSAGQLDAGVPASSGSVRAMAARGIDLDTHRSRVMTRELVEDADLVVCMARSHLREAAVAAPRAFSRTFTLRELVRRGEALGRRRPGQTIGEWLEEVSAGRRSGDLLGDDPNDDVADPIGGPDREYERTAAQLEDLIDRLVRLLA